MADGQQKAIDDYLKVRKSIPKAVKGSTSVKPKAANKEKTDQKDTTAKDEEGLHEFNLLRQFDLNPAYGPSIDSYRMDRWIRADSLGLNPPEEIKSLILNHINDSAYTRPIWQHHPLLFTQSNA